MQVGIIIILKVLFSDFFIDRHCTLIGGDWLFSGWSKIVPDWRGADDPIASG